MPYPTNYDKERKLLTEKKKQAKIANNPKSSRGERDRAAVAIAVIEQKIFNKIAKKAQPPAAPLPPPPPPPVPPTGMTVITL